METTTATQEPRTPTTARALVSVALDRYADFIQVAINEAKQESATPEAWQDSPSRVAWEADLALLRKMALNVTGWTHTTRLREFLESVSS